MRTSLTSGHSCQAPGHAARFSGKGAGSVWCEQVANNVGLRQTRVRLSEAMGRFVLQGAARREPTCHNATRSGRRGRSARWAATSINHRRNALVLPWPVKPSLTNLSDNADQVHATVGVRPVAASSAGGRIPRIAWTSKHDVDSSIGLRSRKPYSQSQEIGRRRKSIDACCRPLTSPISSLGRSCRCS